MSGTLSHANHNLHLEPVKEKTWFLLGTTIYSKYFVKPARLDFLDILLKEVLDIFLFLRMYSIYIFAARYIYMCNI